MQKAARAQIVQADVSLQPGTTTTTVEVNDALPQINVTNPEIGRTVQPQEIAALPLINRNLVQARGTKVLVDRSLYSL